MENWNSALAQNELFRTRPKAGFTLGSFHTENRAAVLFITSPCALLRCTAKSCESRRVRLREERKLRAEMSCRRKAS